MSVDFGCRSFRFHATHEEALVTLEAVAYEQRNRGTGGGSSEMKVKVKLCEKGGGEGHVKQHKAEAKYGQELNE